MMFWTWVFNVLQMYHHLPSNRPYRTATSRTRLWQEGSKLGIFEKSVNFDSKNRPQNLHFVFQMSSRCFYKTFKIKFENVQVRKWWKSTHIGNYCWRYPLKGIVKKVFGKWARKTSGKWRNYRFWFVTCSRNTQKQTSIIYSLEKVAVFKNFFFSSEQMTYI